MRTHGAKTLVLALLLGQPPSTAAQTSPSAWTPETTLRVKRVGGAALSPDGARVAFEVGVAVTDGEKSEWLSHVWVADRNGHQRQLTQGEDGASSPAWSPDGRWLGFLSSRSGSANVWRLPADGGEARQVTDAHGAVGAFRWSPDGTRIAFLVTDPPTEDEGGGPQGETGRPGRGREPEDDPSLGDPRGAGGGRGAAAAHARELHGGSALRWGTGLRLVTGPTETGSNRSATPTATASVLDSTAFHHRLVHEGGWPIAWWGEGRPVFLDAWGGEHSDGRCAPPPRTLGDPVQSLVERNRAAGPRPDGWTAGARWKRETDIPDAVYFGALEAMGQGARTRAGTAFGLDGISSPPRCVGGTGGTPRGRRMARTSGEVGRSPTPLSPESPPETPFSSRHSSGRP